MANDPASRFRGAYDTLIERMPDPPRYEDIRRRVESGSGPGRVRGLATALASACLVVALVGVAAWLSGGLGSSDSVQGAIPVTHQAYTYRQEVEAICEGGTIVDEGRFDEYDIETWIGRNGDLRSVVTYPDFTTFEVVRQGTNPGLVYTRGAAHGRAVSCRFGEATIVLATPQDRPVQLAFGWPPGLVDDFGQVDEFDSDDESLDFSPELVALDELCEHLPAPGRWFLGAGDEIFTQQGGHCIAEIDGRDTRVQLSNYTGTFRFTIQRVVDERTAAFAAVEVTDEASGTTIAQLGRKAIENTGRASVVLTVDDDTQMTVGPGFFSTADMNRDSVVYIETDSTQP